jgi:hypothetical protein
VLGKRFYRIFRPVIHSTLYHYLTQTSYSYYRARGVCRIVERNALKLTSLPCSSFDLTIFISTELHTKSTQFPDPKKFIYANSFTSWQFRNVISTFQQTIGCILDARKFSGIFFIFGCSKGNKASSATTLVFCVRLGVAAWKKPTF